MSPAQEFILFSVVGDTVDKPNTDNFVTQMSLRTIVTMSFRTIVQTRTSSIHSGSKLSPTRDSDIILFWSMRSSNRPSSAIAMDEMVRLNIPYVGRYDHRHALFLFPSTRRFGSANFFECGSHSSSDVAQKISRMHVAIDFFLGRLPTQDIIPYNINGTNNFPLESTSPKVISSREVPSYSISTRNVFDRVAHRPNMISAIWDFLQLITEASKYPNESNKHLFPSSDNRSCIIKLFL